MEQSVSQPPIREGGLSRMAGRRGSAKAACDSFPVCECASYHDAEDPDARIKVPFLALWGKNSTIGALYNVLETWREKATNVEGRAFDCGHTLQEQRRC
jgi:haloacetate dehalogenase